MAESRVINLVVFFIFPMTVSAMLITMYFSGIDILQQIVSPMRRENLAVAMREFGLLENLQNLYLLIIIVISCYGIRKKALTKERLAWLAVAAIAVFVFLEEIDYGLNFYDFLTQAPPGDVTQVRNIHNAGDLNKQIKITVDLILVCVFVLAPFVLWRSGSALIRYVLPNRWFALTVLGMALLSSLAHRLDDAGLAQDGSLNHNITEFRELTIYYVWMLYLYELVWRRRYREEVR